MDKQKFIELEPSRQLNNVNIYLPSSKSESNRALIINALSGNKSHLINLSSARDTQTMIKLLESDDIVLDVLDAGTTMRFLIAYLAVTNKNRILTGTKRMCERPVSILVEALKELGAEIEYQQQSGYPPVKISGLKSQQTDHIKIKGNVSSQYISALLMIAPVLPLGLKLELTGKIYSKPYIEMTLQLMKHFGVSYSWEDHIIQIQPQDYKAINYEIESDWSGASYWFSIVALADKAKINLIGLREDSLQGDIRIVPIMEKLGVRTVFKDKIVELSKIPHQSEIESDFTNYPDLAQTVAVACALKGVSCKMTGLESLRIKETDRILALQNELKKIGANLFEEKGKWTLVPAKSVPPAHSILSVETYEDHRMAMAFAPLATQVGIKIQHPEVVNKSYPSFWEDLKKAGIKIKEEEN